MTSNGKIMPTGQKVGAVQLGVEPYLYALLFLLSSHVTGTKNARLYR